MLQCGSADGVTRALPQTSIYMHNTLVSTELNELLRLTAKMFKNSSVFSRPMQASATERVATGRLQGVVGV